MLISLALTKKSGINVTYSVVVCVEIITLMVIPYQLDANNCNIPTMKLIIVPYRTYNGRANLNMPLNVRNEKWGWEGWIVAYLLERGLTMTTMKLIIVAYSPYYMPVFTISLAGGGCCTTGDLS